LPAFVPPQLATPQAEPPAGKVWLHEIKFDGYRALVRIDRGHTIILTRGGHDWTHRYGDLASAFAAVRCTGALIDGEVIVQDQRGVSSFSALQEALSHGGGGALVFYAFDCLHLDGFDLTEVPLRRRKQILHARLRPLLSKDSPLQLSEHLPGDGAAVLVTACRMGLEGIVSKRADAPYRSGRSPFWVKSKCVSRDAFIIVGFTTSAEAGGLAALHLAEADERALSYIGKVGTGFSRAEAGRLERALAPLIRTDPPLPLPADTDTATTTWVEPRLLADVRYAERTAGGLLRHAVYQGLRGDSEPGAATASQTSAGAAVDARSEAAHPSAPPIPGRSKAFQVSEANLAATWVTNPGRPMFADDGPTKLDIVLYYARVAPLLLPQLANRPLSLLRCPTGRAADCFFQRHAAIGMPDAIATVEMPVSAGTALKAPHPLVRDVRGLLALANFGVVEIHPWGCRADRPEAPDRLIFDLDPDEALPWQAVAEGAALIRDRLAAIGLPAFVKTSGGKGLHIHVPLRRRHDWEAHGRFAEAFAIHLCQQWPTRFTHSSAKRMRRDRIYIDHLRNRRGATAIGAYALRARPGLPVALPLDWSEISAVEDPSTITYSIINETMADPWRDLGDSAVALTNKMAKAIGLAEL
jgi:DNA ligase D